MSPNKATVVIRDVEVDAEKVLSFLTGAEKKVNSAGPGAVAGLATLLGAAANAIALGGEAAAADGVNIPLDVATVTSLKAIWPDLVSFAAEFGIKI